MRLPVALALTVVIAGASEASQTHAGPKGPTLRQRTMARAPDMVLMDQDGLSVRLAALQGRPVILTFIYTSCPDVCPLITADMVRIQRLLKTRGGPDVFFLSVTTDPEVDRPDVLKAYAERHGADLASWAFLTGTPTELKTVWDAYAVKVVRRARGLVDHTGITNLVDRRGWIRYRYRGWTLDAPTVVADVERLSAEGKTSSSGRRP